jgi:hypothetical protein
VRRLSVERACERLVTGHDAGDRISCRQLLPLPTTPHNEVLVQELHGDLSGMCIRVEAL